jgi:hypothetical protein
VGNNAAAAPGGSIFGGDGSSLYAENNFEDDSNPGFQAPANSINTSSQTPAGIDAPIIVNNGFVAGGANGAGSNTALFRSNGNSVTVSGAGSGLKMAVTEGGVASHIENDGTVGGSQSLFSVSAGGFVSTGRLVDIAATVNGAGSSIVFLSAGDNGLTGFNSSINLTGGLWAESPVISWASITAEQLFVEGVLGSLSVNGVAAVWGSDPLVYEPGDNVLFSAATFVNTLEVRNPTLPQNQYYAVGQPARNGFSMIAVPEPSTALLGVLGAGMFLRRRR